jgi:hypothetical protein
MSASFKANVYSLELIVADDGRLQMEGSKVDR